MTEPQVWTLIGVFAAAIFGVLTFGFSALRSELKNSISALRGELGSLRNEMTTRFESMNHRFDNVDRDVQYLMRKEFGENPSN